MSERENLRITGTSDNPILKSYRFTNINRDHDRGSKELKQWSEGKSNDIVAWTIADYRFRGSNREYFGYDNRKLTSTAYQVPRCNKGQRWLDVSDVMTTAIQQSVEHILQSKWQIRELTDYLIELTASVNDSGIQYFFHVGEIAKDFAMIFPDKVDPESECYLGKGAVIGLKAIEGNVSKCPTNTLKGKVLKAKHEELSKKLYELKFDNWSFSNMEHALCEYGKYEKIRLFGGGRKYIKKGL